MDIMPLTLSCPLTQWSRESDRSIKLKERAGRIYLLRVPAAAFFFSCMPAVLNGEDYCL